MGDCHLTPLLYEKAVINNNLDSSGGSASSYLYLRYLVRFFRCSYLRHILRMNECYCSKELGYTCHVCHKPEPWEENKEALAFVDWYFGNREHWSIHDFPRASLVGNKILDLLANQNTANAERIRGLKKPRCRCMCQASNIAAIHNEAIEAAARLIEK